MQLTVDKPANLIRIPVDGESVIISVEIDIEVSLAAAAVNVVGPGAAVVNRAQKRVTAKTAVFHDVDLAAGGPAAVDRLGRHHPDGGPEVLAVGQLGARLELAVRPLLAFPVLRDEARRRVLLVGPRLHANVDCQVPVLDAGVFVPVHCIAFQFVVTPT